MEKEIMSSEFEDPKKKEEEINKVQEVIKQQNQTITTKTQQKTQNSEAELFRKAAEQGDEEAKKNLDQLMEACKN